MSDKTLIFRWGAMSDKTLIFETLTPIGFVGVKVVSGKKVFYLNRKRTTERTIQSRINAHYRKS